MSISAIIPIVIKRAALALWQGENPVLKWGELGVILEENATSSKPRIIIGDGVSTFLQLYNNSRFFLTYEDLNQNYLAALSTSLQALITAEANARVGVDSGLQTQITANVNSLNSLLSSLSTLSTNLSNESTARQNADVSIWISVDANASSILQLQTNILNWYGEGVAAGQILAFNIDTGTFFPTAAPGGEGKTLRSTGGTDTGLEWVDMFSENYNDLLDLPTLFSGSYNDLSNKPTLFSGSYNDLTNKPIEKSFYERSLEAYEHFNDFMSAVVVSSHHEVMLASGSGASNGIVSQPSDAIGALSSTTGTTATGYSGVRSGQIVVNNNSLPQVYETRIKIAALSTAVDSFTLRLGFNQSTVAADGTHYSMIRYNHSVFGGNWELVTRNASGIDSVDSNIPVIINTYYKLKIEMSNEDSKFYINGVLIATLSTRIPSGVLVHNTLIVKSVGLIARTMNVDYYYIKCPAFDR